MWNDKETVKKCLDTTYEQLVNQINDIVKRMKEADAALLERRS